MKLICFFHIFFHFALALRPSDIYSHEMNLSAAPHSLAEVNLGPGNLLNCKAEARGLATNTGMGRFDRVWSHDTWVQVDKDLGIMQEKGPPSDGLIGNTVASSFAALADEVREAMNAAKACQDELKKVDDDKVGTLIIATVKVGECIKTHFQPYFNDDDVFEKEHSGLLLKELMDIPKALGDFYMAAKANRATLDCFQSNYEAKHTDGAPPEGLIPGTFAQWVRHLVDLFTSPTSISGIPPNGGWYSLCTKCADDEGELRSQKIIVDGPVDHGRWHKDTAAKYLQEEVDLLRGRGRGQVVWP